MCSYLVQVPLKKNEMTDFLHTNALINETSPYLLQHAHNPVNWMPWGQEALQLAKSEQKPLLVSIGYSACHWCHVMEHESFEKEKVAEIMNRYFICIKVDREEHPDVDQVYMNAVQLMTGQGGWPLNIVALPDGRPFWGGTYFPKEQWVDSLKQIHNIYTTDFQRVVEYANKLQEGIKSLPLMDKKMLESEQFNAVIQQGVATWKEHFDREFGGQSGAPKFMLPNNLEFLLHYGKIRNDSEVLTHVKNSLTKMALGGVYDQLGGGFSRYSVDARWKVPHFEKMLYDNAQLISLYTKAYAHFQNPLFKQVVDETVDFVDSELKSPEGFFYAALDADSDGEEGKFYVWKKSTLQHLLGDTYELFSAYYNINSNGYWEEGNYILLRTETDDTFAKEHNISAEALTEHVQNWKHILFKERDKRIRPGLDDKSLLSWNAMMSAALLDAWEVCGNRTYLQLALKNAHQLSTIMMRNGGLWRSYKNGQAKIGGFLEDYAFLIRLFLQLFCSLGEEEWLEKAIALTSVCRRQFWNEDLKAYAFTPLSESPLVSHQYEMYDNVIPSSNAIMADNLYTLSVLTGNMSYREQSGQMLSRQMSHFGTYPQGHSQWGMTALKYSHPFYEVVIIGKEAHSFLQKVREDYYPDTIFLFKKEDSDLPIFKDRFNANKTLIYVCRNHSCLMPVEYWEEAVALLKAS